MGARWLFTRSASAERWKGGSHKESDDRCAHNLAQAVQCTPWTLTPICPTRRRTTIGEKRIPVPTVCCSCPSAGSTDFFEFLSVRRCDDNAEEGIFVEETASGIQSEYTFHGRGTTTDLFPSSLPQATAFSTIPARRTATASACTLTRYVQCWEGNQQAPVPSAHAYN